MIGSRKVKYAGAVLILLALALCAVMVWFPDLLPIARSDAATQKEYEHGLFGTGTLLEIEILMAEEDWQDLLDNPTDKTEVPLRRGHRRRHLRKRRHPDQGQHQPEPDRQRSHHRPLQPEDQI